MSDVKSVEIVDQKKIFKTLNSISATGLGIFRLSDFKGKWVVLYFYPKDATPGCTQEGHEFSQLKKKFNKLNCEVFGVSRDSMKSHEKFKENENYTIDLISDTDEAVCNTFQVIKEKNMYGKKVMGIERSTFLLNPAGEVSRTWRKVKVDGHAEEVLEALMSLVK